MAYKKGSRFFQIEKDESKIERIGGRKATLRWKDNMIFAKKLANLMEYNDTKNILDYTFNDRKIICKSNPFN